MNSDITTSITQDLSQSNIQDCKHSKNIII